MKKLPGVFFVLVFGAFSATTVSADVARKDARALLERSGIAEQVMNSDALLQARLDEFPKEAAERIPARWLEQMEAMFRSLIDPQEILDLLERGLAEELSQSNLVALSEFYDSPLARRIVVAETSASTPAGWDRIDESFDALEARLDRNPVRENLLGRLDEARRYSEIEAASAAAVYAGLAQGVMAAVGKELEISYEFRFGASRISFLESLRYDNLIPMIYTYGPITDDEIEQYFAFLLTPSATKFYDTVELAGGNITATQAQTLPRRLPNFVSDLIGKSPVTADGTPTTGDETPSKAEVTEKDARELLERSGAAQLMAGYAADRERNAATLPYALDFESVHPDLRDAFVGLFRQWVDAESLVGLAEHSLSRSLSQDDLDSLKAFYTSPLGERTVALEVAATTQQAMNRVREEMDELAPAARR